MAREVFEKQPRSIDMAPDVPRVNVTCHRLLDRRRADKTPPPARNCLVWFAVRRSAL